MNLPLLSANFNADQCFLSIILTSAPFLMSHSAARWRPKWECTTYYLFEKEGFLGLLLLFNFWKLFYTCGGVKSCNQCWSMFVVYSIDISTMFNEHLHHIYVICAVIKFKFKLLRCMRLYWLDFWMFWKILSRFGSKPNDRQFCKSFVIDLSLFFDIFSRIFKIRATLHEYI